MTVSKSGRRVYLPARRPTWPALPLDGDPLRDTAIRTAGGLLALTTYHLRTP